MYNQTSEFIQSCEVVGRMKIDSSTLKQLEIIGDKNVSLNN